MTELRKAYADTSFGQVHFVECGTGAPVLLLHQTPRSWDEYAELLPLLGRRVRAIAMDTIGFGASAPLAEHTIGNYAAAAIELLDALGIDEVDLLGHHTGGVVAVEIAAREPRRVRRAVLSSTPYIDAEARQRRRRRPRTPVSDQMDGSHLLELWHRRQDFYPADRPDLLSRYVRDALILGADVERGHDAVSAYRMEERIGLIRCPVLCLGASADPFAFPELERLAGQLPTADKAVIDGGMVPLMEQHATEVTGLVLDFLLSR